MIKVIGDWYITIEDAPVVQYIVRRGDGNRKERRGWTDKPLCFAASLAGALSFIRRQIIAEKLSEGRTTLADALLLIREEDARLEKLFESVTA